MVATLIVPGLNGSAEGHWQRHWLRDDPSARLVEQASWSKPVLDAWLSTLEDDLERAGEAWLVAHSLGCLLAARLAGRASARRVRGALLVAPCDLGRVERLHPGAVDFGAMPTAALPFPAQVIGSRDDPYMDFDRLCDHAARWGSDVVDLGHAGHINIASGFGRWVDGYGRLAALRAGGDRRKKGPLRARSLEALSAS